MLSGIGRFISILASRSLYFARLRLALGSVTVTKDSKDAFNDFSLSSYVSYGPIVTSTPLSRSIQCLSDS